MAFPGLTIIVLFLLACKACTRWAEAAIFVGNLELKDTCYDYLL